MASNLRVDSIVPATGGSVSIGTATGGVTIPGNLGIAGVLTYEDVTNIDSVGVITARDGLRVTGVTTITGTGEYLLQLNKSDSSAVYTQFTNSTSGTSTSDGFRIGMDSNEDGLVWLREDGNVKFGTDNSERLRIGGNGEIGIGGANYGTSGQFLQSQGSGSPVQWASVSTDLQFAQWRVTTPFGGGNVDPITNWSETDANATLTQSGGIFSFPSTGYWEIMMQMYGYKNTDNDNIELHIMTTTNNSSYTTRSWAYSHMNNDDGGNLYVSIRASLIFDVTNTSTHKIKFKTINNTVNWAADSGVNNSYAIFKRLAAT